jgi:hypothetical protein
LWVDDFVTEITPNIKLKDGFGMGRRPRRELKAASTFCGETFENPRGVASANPVRVLRSFDSLRALVRRLNLLRGKRVIVRRAERMSSPMDRSDWTLIAICAGEGKGLSPVQLQKSLFLFGRDMPNAVGSTFYKFRPYHYGPFDEDVYIDAARLAHDGLIAIAQSPGQSWNQYVATASGCERAEMIRKQDPKAASYLHAIVKWAQGLSFSQLVRAVYDKYPEMRANSVFQG